MKQVLIMCALNPQNDPRPNRMINCLKNAYRVTVIGSGNAQIDGIDYIPAKFGRNKAAVRKLKDAFNLKLRRFDDVLWTEDLKQLRTKLAGENFSLIITHDLRLLPFALSLKRSHTKVLFDAREYYPRNYDDQILWRFFFRPMNEYLCAKYLGLCDKVITVSEGIAQRYYVEYNVQPEVVTSLPAFHNVLPTPTNDGNIKIIHHGGVSPSRRIEGMIETMDYVDERYSLDLMLMPVASPYWKKLISMAGKRNNVRIIPPVPMQQIIPFINQYDIGLFLCRPTNFNLEFTLPNKLFEFIQARLAVAIGPSVEMKRVVEKYDCGVVSGNFEARTLAQELNKLTAGRIMYFKQQSHRASWELNAETNCQRIKAIVHELIEA